VLRLGLTGGIGSGKSTVARLLVGQGATLIDADAISRAVTSTGGSGIAQIAAQFGRDAITPGGAMNRDVMRQRVFADPGAKKQLEAIIHPLVGAESARQAEAARQAGCALLVFDIPLLVESQRWRQQLDSVLVVDCEPATQISRVLAREIDNRSWTHETVEKVIASQASRAQRLAAADLVIFNDGLTLAELTEQVRKIAEHVTL
jgi:dephospho-CoA kinase